MQKYNAGIWSKSILALYCIMMSVNVKAMQHNMRPCVVLWTDDTLLTDNYNTGLKMDN